MIAPCHIDAFSRPRYVHRSHRLSKWQWHASGHVAPVVKLYLPKIAFNLASTQMRVLIGMAARSHTSACHLRAHLLRQPWCRGLLLLRTWSGLPFGVLALCFISRVQTPSQSSAPQLVILSLFSLSLIIVSFTVVWTLLRCSLLLATYTCEFL